MGIGGAILYSLVVIGARAISQLGGQAVLRFRRELLTFRNGDTLRGAGFYGQSRGVVQRLTGIRPRSAGI
jgi:hypothetical protein